MSDWSKELVAARQAAEKARKTLLFYFGNLSRVEVKHQAGLVSEADRAAEQVIKDHLSGALPQYQFLGEEEAFKHPEQLNMEEGEGLWVVDPLDGTTNYIHRFPIFCISIALVKNRQPVVGVIDIPILNETYWAVRGGGAFKNGHPITVSKALDLSLCLAATGFNSERETILNEQLRVFDRLVRKVRGVRRPGSAAFDLCMVASGVFAFFWEQALSPWDVAAGQLLVEEAGGRNSTFLGQPYNPWAESILASNGSVHDDIVKIISDHQGLEQQ